MKGIEIKEFLRRKGWNLAQIAELLEMSQQNFSAALAKDDIKTGLVERIAAATDIPLLEFYGAPASEGCSVSGENNIVNNGRDQTTVDPQLVAVLMKHQAQMGELIQMMKADREKLENLTKK